MKCSACDTNLGTSIFLNEIFHVIRLPVLCAFVFSIDRELHSTKTAVFSIQIDVGLVFPPNRLGS
jgi:hypothetical protein